MNQTVSQPINLSLGEQLRQLRTSRHMTGLELAKRSGLSQSDISKIENDRYVPSAKKVSKILNILKPTKDIQQHVDLLLLRETTATPKVFRYVNNNESLEAVLSRAQVSSLIQIFSVNTLPVYLQTIEYREALLRALKTPDSQLRAALTETQQRQDLLWDTARKFVFIFPEAVLYTLITSPQAHLAQLDRVDRMASFMPQTVGIIPMERGFPVPPLTTFGLYDQRELCREICDHELFNEDEATVLLYIKLFHDLKTRAHFGQDAQTILHKAYRYFEKR